MQPWDMDRLYLDELQQYDAHLTAKRQAIARAQRG